MVLVAEVEVEDRITLYGSTNSPLNYTSDGFLFIRYDGE